MQVAFLGTGLMGAPMAVRIAGAGVALKVWNRSPEKAEVLREAGAIPCITARQAVGDAAIVCLCLTDAAAIEDLLFGANGVAAALPRGCVVVDFSTIGVSAARDFASRLDGIAWLDAPVSGGVAGAKAGTLVIFAGGDAAVLERAQPVLQHVAARVTLMGDVGAGQAAKLCNQLIVSTNLLAIAEAIALGEKLGVDVAQLPGALAGGFADSRPLQIFGPRMAAKRDPGPPVAEVRTMHKDVLAILDAANAAGASSALLQHVEALYARVDAAGFGSSDLPALMRLYREDGDGQA